jgi:ribosome maturation factor RimP
MTRHDPIAQRVMKLIEPVCIAAGYELVDLRFLMDQGGWVLRVFIDRLPVARPEAVAEAEAEAAPARQSEVDLDDCERMSRELSAVLDVEDPIPQAYQLEVSSPGVDRPLRTVDHFRRYAGAEVKLQLAAPLHTPTGERRNFRGVLHGVEPADATDDAHAFAVVEVDHQGKDAAFRLRVADIESARVVPDWDAILHPNSTHKPKPKQGRAKARK